MTRFTRLFVFFLLLFVTGNALSQDSSAVKFSYNTQRVNDHEVLVSIKGKIAPGIKLFALQKSAEDLLYSSIQFDTSIQKQLVDSVESNGREQKMFDTSLSSEVYFFTDSVKWQQKVKANLSDSFLVKGNVSI